MRTGLAGGTGAGGALLRFDSVDTAAPAPVPVLEIRSIPREAVAAYVLAPLEIYGVDSEPVALEEKLVVEQNALPAPKMEIEPARPSPVSWLQRSDLDWRLFEPGNCLYEELQGEERGDERKDDRVFNNPEIIPPDSQHRGLHGDRLDFSADGVELHVTHMELDDPNRSCFFQVRLRVKKR